MQIAVAVVDNTTPLLLTFPVSSQPPSPVLFENPARLLAEEEEVRHVFLAKPQPRSTSVLARRAASPCYGGNSKQSMSHQQIENFYHNSSTTTNKSQ